MWIRAFPAAVINRRLISASGTSILNPGMATIWESRRQGRYCGVIFLILPTSHRSAKSARYWNDSGIKETGIPESCKIQVKDLMENWYALAIGPLSIIIAIISLHFVIAILLSVWIYRENLNPFRIAGIALTILSIVLLRH